MEKEEKDKNVLGLVMLLKKINKSFITLKTKNRFFLLIGVDTISGQIWIGTTLIWSYLLNYVVETQKTTTEPFAIIAHVLFFVFLFQLINWIRSMASTYGRVIEREISNDMVHGMKLLFLERKLNWEAGDREDPKHRDLIDRAYNNYGSVAEVFIVQRKLLQNFLTFVIAFVGIMTIHWWYVIPSILSVIPAMVYFFRLNKKNHERSNRVVESNRYRGYLSEKVGDNSSRLNRRIDYLLPRFISASFLSNRFQTMVFKSYYKYTWILNAWSLFMYAIVMSHSTANAALGLMTIGVLNLSFNYYQRVNDGLWDLNENLSTVFRNLRSCDEFFKFLEFKSSMIHKEDGVRIPKSQKLEIEFRNVWFKYPAQKENEWVLKNVSFKINDGERIGLIGENGSGKSTIVGLLLRMYDPNKGAIYVNGTDLRDLDRKQYLEHFGVLEQDYYLFNGMFQNVIKGDRPYSEEKIIKAAKIADIHDMIINTESGYESNYGNIYKHGIRCSGGERQKLALAYVKYANPNVVVLDEPTSAMSPLAEKRIFDAYNEAFGDKTLILVSHRFKSLDQVSRILLFDDGNLLADGSHSFLMNTNKYYKEMFHSSIPDKFEVQKIEPAFAGIH